jgi:hypothetical protein
LRLPIARRRDGEREYDAAPFPALADPNVPLPSLDGGMPLLDQGFGNADGMLGAPWFAGRTFTFDYAGKALLLRPPGMVPQTASAHRVPMGLRRDASGQPVSPYGRIDMQVDGETIDMLFDTGATVVLTAAGRQALGGEQRERATCFITERVFDRWRQAHPDWRVIEHADETARGAPMIEVPSVTLGGHVVGPVWFTWRPNRAFHEWMAQWMDEPTDGAIGGSALRHFRRVTADWVNAVVVFEK